MRVGTCHLRLAVDGARSLKDKRRVIKSLKDRVGGTFNVSISEVGAADYRQSAELGIAVVSNDSRFCREMLDKVVDWVRHFHGCRLVDYEIEVF